MDSLDQLCLNRTESPFIGAQDCTPSLLASTRRKRGLPGGAAEDTRILSRIGWLCHLSQLANSAARRVSNLDRLTERAHMTARRLRKGASSAGHQAEQAKGISVSEVAYQNIIDALYRGRFVPGQRLIEADIIRDFKLSRGSVREALKKLAAEGVVARSLHRGAQIRWLSRAEAEDALSLLELVIGFAGRLAAIKIDEGDHRSRFATISEHLVSLDRLEHMQLEILAARDQFFRTMVEVGGNRVLRRLYPSMQSHLLRVQLRAFPVASQRSRRRFRPTSRARITST